VKGHYIDKNLYMSYKLNMKILLLEPQAKTPYSINWSSSPPLGLAYLASVLKKNHDVTVVDLNVDSMPNLSNFELIGISSLTATIDNALKLAKMAKQAGAYVVMGGVHPTFMDRDVLKTGFVDFVVRGEAEETFPELIRYLKRNKELSALKGVSTLKDGKFYRLPDAIPPQNLDDIPFPDRTFFNLKKYEGHLQGEKMMTIITSRGCPYNCSFCSTPRFNGRKWRARSPKNVVDEIEMIYRDLGYRAIYIMDDNFTINPERVIKICDELLKRKIKIIWWAMARADSVVRNQDMIRIMAESGAREIFLGLETPNPSVLNSYQKRTPVDVYPAAIKILKNYGIKAWGAFILGHPSEKKEDILRTIKYSKELELDEVQFTILTPFPGTPSFYTYQDRLLTRDWRLYNTITPIIEMDYLTPEEIKYLLTKAYIEFYFYRARIVKKLFAEIKAGVFWKSQIRRINNFLLNKNIKTTGIP